MAHSMTGLQIPHTLSSHFAALTSRPGVQSTLILSRKNGSIIQITGHLASQSQRPPSKLPSPVLAPAARPPGAALPSPSAVDSSTDTEVQTPETSAGSNPEAGSNPAAEAAPAEYQPTAAEVVAAHILTFVATATALSSSLVEPNKKKGDRHGESLVGGSKEFNGESAGLERETDEDVRLLRLRTKAHEIIIIPDRKFLLCVVHDLSHGSNAPKAGR